MPSMSGIMRSRRMTSKRSPPSAISRQGLSAVGGVRQEPDSLVLEGLHQAHPGHRFILDHQHAGLRHAPLPAARHLSASGTFATVRRQPGRPASPITAVRQAEPVGGAQAGLRGRWPGTPREQVAAGRCFPVEHFAGAKDPGQRLSMSRSSSSAATPPAAADGSSSRGRVATRGAAGAQHRARSAASPSRCGSTHSRSRAAFDTVDAGLTTEVVESRRIPAPGRPVRRPGRLCRGPAPSRWRAPPAAFQRIRCSAAENCKSAPFDALSGDIELPCFAHPGKPGDHRPDWRPGKAFAEEGGPGHVEAAIAGRGGRHRRSGLSRLPRRRRSRAVQLRTAQGYQDGGLRLDLISPAGAHQTRRPSLSHPCQRCRT